MFSYLHGIRPSNRRSAVPPTAPPQSSPSRYYHETSTSAPLSSFNFDPPPPQAHSLNEASPISSEPPILPPIPRVASQNEGRPSEKKENSAEKNHRIPNSTRRPQGAEPTYLKGTTNEANGQVMVRDSQSNETWQEGKAPQPASTLQQALPAQSRRKRPIDHAYDYMRSYSEPPGRPLPNKDSGKASFLPPPTRQPPPPPSKSTYIQSIPQRQAPPPPVTTHPQVPPATTQRGHGKTKLNLLNPMSLLARRLTSQNVEEAHSQNQNTPPIPDDFDPRIRGKVVHDFSAPRPERPQSSNENQDTSLAKLKAVAPNRNSASNQEEESPSSTEKEHMPVFKENFDDDVEPWSSDMNSPAKRRSSAFMYQVSLQASQQPSQSSLPAFARNLPSNLSCEIDTLRKSSPPPPKAPLPVLLETPLSNQEPAKPSTPTSPPYARSRSASNTDAPSLAPGSPQRFKSNASRFSFDLAGVGSAAQEKLLEEKHRQKAKQRQHEDTSADGNELDEDDIYDNFDDMEEEGLEERIPGVNADDEDSDMPMLQHATDNVNFISPNKSSFESVASPVSTGLTSPGTPHESQGQPTGSLVSKSPQQYHSRHEENEDSSTAHRLRLKSSPGDNTDSRLHAQPLQREVASETNLAGLHSRHIDRDDDMYFDDGMIEDFDDGEHQAFDESVFDDDTNAIFGVPLRDLKRMPKTHHDQDQDRDNSVHGQSHDPVSASRDHLIHNRGSLSLSLPKPSVHGQGVSKNGTSIDDLKKLAPIQTFSNTTGLTQDNLGLHDRLAYAANQAALEGKFNRTYSQGSTQNSHDGPKSSMGTQTQENQPSGSYISPVMGYADDFAFDDTNAAFSEAEDDDPIIAAANAEALENDDDGFYGQEFGFFARQPGSSESEYVNGGYFGSRTNEGIHRMNSGRDNFQEPSLTPITERSEWSNRNSMVSLAMHGYPLSAQYQSNPHLVDLMRVQEGEEMSLEGLRRLRRGAWGGSNGSLPSGSNSQNGGSPLISLPPGAVAPLMQTTNSNGSLMSPSSKDLTGSQHSFGSGGQASSNGSNSSPSAESPTITLSNSQSGLMLQQPMGPPPPPPPKDPLPKRIYPLEPKPWVAGHSRNSSGAESVSYREENGRWLCEKTRVIEGTGEIEVLGRSVVEGGRI